MLEIGLYSSILFAFKTKNALVTVKKCVFYVTYSYRRYPILSIYAYCIFRQSQVEPRQRIFSFERKPTQKIIMVNLNSIYAAESLGCQIP